MHLYVERKSGLKKLIGIAMIALRLLAPQTVEPLIAPLGPLASILYWVVAASFVVLG